jgi:hypothetical protein
MQINSGDDAWKMEFSPIFKWRQKH